MLVLTLYKDTILNETYQNVFSLGKKNNISVLESYLANKTKLVINLPYVYYENTGELVIDYDLISNNNIYEYNYIKIIEYNDDTEEFRLLRYCFIDDINIKNGCVYLKYIEDIWSSYSDKIMGIAESYIINSRLKGYPNFNISVIENPNDYKSNKELIYIRQDNNSSHLFKIYCQFQLYTLSQQGVPTKRKNFVFKLLLKYQEGQEIWYEDNHYISDIYPILNELVYAMGVYQIKLGQTSYSFEIGNIYVLPYTFDIATETEQQSVYTLEDEYGIRFKLAQVNLAYMTSCFTNTIQSNYKNLKIGTFNNSIDIKNIGKNSFFNILYSCDGINISLMLSYQNELLNITNDYAINAPYQSLRSEQIAQQNLDRTTKNALFILEKLQAGINIGGNIAKTSTGVGQVIVSALLGNFSGVFSGASKMQSGITGGLSDVNNLEKLKIENIANNSPVYSTTIGIFGNDMNLLNSYFGITLFRIDSMNDDFVKKSINNFGYKIYEFINDLSLIKLLDVDFFERNNINYNIIKFDTINVYGSFPREVAKVLNEIFESGIKIWYNPNMEEDNYVI